ncbi:MAG: hypothetical protein Q9208_004087 [Pyrenodesmia sp. 3 TL-2023]
MSDELAAVERHATPPSTPVSCKPTLSSQTSTGKSKYKRKFDKNLLATPSSKASVSPATTAKSSPNLLSAAEDEPSTPVEPPQQSSLEYQTLLRNYEHDQILTVPDVAYHPYPGAIPAPPILQPQFPPPPVPEPQHATSMYYSQSYQPGNMTCYTSATYQISPSPPSAANAPYGGEAHRRAPVGINPSPPAARNPGGEHHTIAQSMPTIVELPTQPAIASLQTVSRDHESKLQKFRNVLKRIGHRAKY